MTAHVSGVMGRPTINELAAQMDEPGDPPPEPGTKFGELRNQQVLPAHGTIKGRTMAEQTKEPGVIGYGLRKSDGEWGSWLYPYREWAERAAKDGAKFGYEVVPLKPADGVPASPAPEKHRCSAHPWHKPDCPDCIAQNTGEDASGAQPSGETEEQRREVCAAWNDLPESLRCHPGLKRLYRALGGIQRDGDYAGGNDGR